MERTDKLFRADIASFIWLERPFLTVTQANCHTIRRSVFCDRRPCNDQDAFFLYFYPVVNSSFSTFHSADMDIHTGADTFHIDGFCRCCISRSFHAEDQYKSCHQHKQLTHHCMFSFFTLFHFFFSFPPVLFFFPFLACEVLCLRAIPVLLSYHIPDPCTRIKNMPETFPGSVYLSRRLHSH